MISKVHEVIYIVQDTRASERKDAKEKLEDLKTKHDISSKEVEQLKKTIQSLNEEKGKLETDVQNSK